MMRKITALVLGMSSLWFNPASATVDRLLGQGIEMTFELEANVPEIWVNKTFWPITAVCTVISDDSKNSISITAIRKNGILNDVVVSTGDSIQVTINSGDKLHIQADSGAKFELLNHGPNLVRTICTT